MKGIVIPSEEHRISVYPMDYEEFMWAIGERTDLLKSIANSGTPLGDSRNRSLMGNFRLYIAVGGMPQAVDAYIRFNNLNRVDEVKREIIGLYLEDFKKIDASGRMSDMFKSVPSQLVLKKKRFVLTAATGKKKTSRDEVRLFDLIDSKIVQPCYHVTEPSPALLQTKKPNNFRLYLSDTGLLTTTLFNNGNGDHEGIYRKLLSDKLDANLGYLYENAAAQILTACGRELFYHTWAKENSTHSYGVDFLVTDGDKVIPIEIKSSAARNQDSISRFAERYGGCVGSREFSPGCRYFRRVAAGQGHRAAGSLLSWRLRRVDTFLKSRGCRDAGMRVRFRHGGPVPPSQCGGTLGRIRPRSEDHSHISAKALSGHCGRGPE